MHESSLVKTLLKQVEEIRRQHDAKRIVEVRVEIGPLSGVEPLLLASAYEQMVADSTAVGAPLVIDKVPLTANCQTCNTEFEIQEFVFRCQQCGGNVTVVRGDTLQLVSVSLCEENRGIPRGSDSNDHALENQKEMTS